MRLVLLLLAFSFLTGCAAIFWETKGGKKVIISTPFTPAKFGDSEVKSPIPDFSFGAVAP